MVSHAIGFQPKVQVRSWASVTQKDMSVGSRGTPKSAKNCRRLGYVSWFITMKPANQPHTRYTTIIHQMG
jgi:hypothetical protein